MVELIFKGLPPDITLICEGETPMNGVIGGRTVIFIE
jgi:hypothetical protein